MSVLVRGLFRRDVPEPTPALGFTNLFVKNPCGEPIEPHIKICTSGQTARLRFSFDTFLVRQEKYAFPLLGKKWRSYKKAHLYNKKFRFLFLKNVRFLFRGSQKTKKLPSTKKGREHKLPRYHPIFMRISHNTLDAYNGALPYTTTKPSLHPLQSERRYTRLRSASSQRQTSLWQTKSYKAAFS